MPRLFTVVRFLLWAVWAVLLGYAIFLGTLPKREAPPDLAPLGDLKVYGPQRKRVVMMKREEAIKLGFGEVTSTINYMFIAAAAILSLVGKIVIDPLVSKEKVPALDRRVVLLLRHAAIGCAISIAAGFFARSEFNMLADSESFTIYGPLGAAALCQQQTFVVAALLMSIALGFLIKGREWAADGEG